MTNLTSIPLAAQLCEPDAQRWVLWRKEVREGKPTKVPYQINGQKADSSDPSTWSTFAEVESARQNFDGIGIVFAGDMLGVDLDHVFESGHETPPHALAFIEKANTYTELSPSGTGAHIYLKLSEPLVLEANRKKIGTYHPDEGYECYTEKRFFTFTGNAYGKAKPVRTVAAAEAVELLTILGYPWKKRVDVIASPHASLASDQEVLDAMFSSKNGGKIRALHGGDTSDHNGDESSADMALCAHLAFWARKNAAQMERMWLASPLGARQKTQERKDYRDRTIATAIQNCKDTYSGDYSATVEDLTRPSQSTQLVELITSNPDVVLFLDQYKVAHARIPRGGHFEVWSCDSSEFKYWMCDEYYKATEGKAAGANGISGALNVLEGRARAGGIRHALHNRIAEHDGAIWYDLCNEEWEAVRIYPGGWQVVKNPPILFRRHTYQDAQEKPVSGGNINDVLQYVNVKGADQELLFLAHLVAAFIPGFPHAILYIHGPQGSAKSSLLEAVHALVDPSHIGTMSLSRNVDELKQVLDHHSAFAGFDNVSYIEEDVSDLLCRAVTGAGFSKRRLYTNGEDYICRVQANIAINGINIMAIKPDLLERSVLMELERMNPTDRKQTKELWAGFIAARPKILGAVLDAVSQALARKPDAQPYSLYRMADYTAWCSTIAEVIGRTPEAFTAAYQRNVEEQNDTVLEAFIEARLVQDFMAGKDRWEGTATSLLGKLKELHGLANEKDLPKNGAALSRRLNVLKPALEAVGLHISASRSTERTLVIKKIIPDAKELVESDERLPSPMLFKVGTTNAPDEIPF